MRSSDFRDTSADCSSHARQSVEGRPRKGLSTVWRRWRRRKASWLRAADVLRISQKPPFSRRSDDAASLRPAATKARSIRLHSFLRPPYVRATRRGECPTDDRCWFCTGKPVARRTFRYPAWGASKSTTARRKTAICEVVERRVQIQILPRTAIQRPPTNRRPRLRQRNCRSDRNGFPSLGRTPSSGRGYSSGR